ncbi:MAG: thermonuclease family protein [Solirubrobacterales bacterium]|jgi:micrococcal nuclease
MELYNYRATVLNVVDGDTVDLTVDVGFRMWMQDRFRLLGINAPEMKTPAGPDAKAFLVSLLPVGTKVLISTRKPRDKWGRWLAEIRRTDANGDPEAVTIDKQMISSGHAVPFMV